MSIDVRAFIHNVYTSLYISTCIIIYTHHYTLVHVSLFININIHWYMYHNLYTSQYISTCIISYTHHYKLVHVSYIHTHHYTLVHVS